MTDKNMRLLSVLIFTESVFAESPRGGYCG